MKSAVTVIVMRLNIFNKRQMGWIKPSYTMLFIRIRHEVTFCKVKLFRITKDANRKHEYNFNKKNNKQNIHV